MNRKTKMPKSFLIRKLLELDENSDIEKVSKDAVITSRHSLSREMYRNASPSDMDMPIIVSAVSLSEEYRSMLQKFPKSKSMIYFPSERCNCHECLNKVYYTSYPTKSLSATTERRSVSPESITPSLSPNGNSSIEGSSDILCCVFCSVKYATKSELEKHVSTHRNDKAYKCQECDRGFTWFGNFQKHMLSHGEDESRRHPYFAFPSACEDKLLIREDNRTFKCGLCFKTFTRMSGLRTHVRMHSGQRPYKCEDCELAFTTNRALKMHTRIHTGERPYKCTECIKTFTRKDELQAHIFLHKGEKPFKCSLCSAAFVRQGHLQRHMLTHADEKPYKCKSCPKSFTQYRNLQTHTYKHTGERPYKCRFCGKGFTQYGTVQAHERTHTGTKPYACDQCDKRFITSSHLRWHVKRHHKNEEEIPIKTEDKTMDM